MPNYLYDCDSCGEQEIHQSINDKVLEQCPNCEGIAFRKKYSSIGIVFKGSGFYTTDSKK